MPGKTKPTKDQRNSKRDVRVTVTTEWCHIYNEYIEVTRVYSIKFKQLVIFNIRIL
jgi:hypothetical protein